MGILNKTLDELSIEIENKVQKALEKIKENEERMQLLKSEIKSETNRLVQISLDEDSEKDSPVEIQKKVRQLRSQLSEAEELAEAYGNMTVIFADKDRKKIRDAYNKERDNYRKEDKELLTKKASLEKEIGILQKQVDEISKTLHWRRGAKPWEDQVETILRKVAEVDSKLAVAIKCENGSYRGLSDLISSWMNGYSLDKFITDEKPSQMIGKMNNHGEIDYY